jgi:hypothetical protein
MSFHSTQVTNPLASGRPTGTARIGGNEFPGFGDETQRLAALEQAMVNIYRAIDALAKHIERIDRELQTRR